jgi:hypothetical protein
MANDTKRKPVLFHGSYIYPYSQEAAARQGKVELVCAVDLETPSAREILLMETAYRRGFQQGACEAVYAQQDGVPLEEVTSWAERYLHEWRYAKHDGHMVRPPTPRINVRR